MTANTTSIAQVQILPALVKAARRRKETKNMAVGQVGNQKIGKKGRLSRLITDHRPPLWLSTENIKLFT
jgi:hypothetical protein